MRRTTTLAAAILAVGLTSGCVVVVGDTDDGSGVDAGWISSYEEESSTRREDNAVLADRVSRRLDEVPALQTEDITVSASGEIVTLFGRLNDIEHLQQAVTAAAEVEGVGRVVSRITLDVRS